MFDHTGALGVFQGFNNLTKEYRINNVAAGGTIAFLSGRQSPVLCRCRRKVAIGKQHKSSRAA